MGEVYRAKDTRLGREVAIKVLPDGPAADPERVRRFEQEARAASALNHANILTVHDVGREHGTSFLVTELLHGESLRETIRRGPLPPEQVIEIARQIAKGLAAAHDRGIVHRDLKPENLFITEDGTIKILDFGLARLTPPLASQSHLAAAPTLEALTAAGTLVGTVGYMAPEQVRGENADARADLFAFGCVLYELLAGARAFARDSAVDTLHAILHDEPPALDASGSDLPPALAGVLRHCLEKSPTQRFHSAHDLLFALEQASSSPTAAASRPRPAPPPRLIRRWVIGLGAVALLAAMSGLFWWRDHAREHPVASPPAPAGTQRSTAGTVAVLPFVNMSGNPDNDYLGDGLAEEVINRLAREGLPVVARTSAFSFKGKEVDIREIASKLGAARIVEGSVRQAGDRLRVTAQLITAASGLHVWSQTFDRARADLFAIQDEISGAIADQLAPPGPGTAEEPGATLAAADPAAYDAYLRGRHDLERWSRESLAAGQRHFELATERDPGLGAAWASLAESLILQHELYQVGEREAVYARAVDAAQRALSASRPSSEGHSALAHVLVHEGKIAAGESEARLALAATPNSAIAQSWLSFALLVEGRFTEAIAHARRAVELDPLSAGFKMELASLLYFAGQFDEGLAYTRSARALGENPETVAGGMVSLLCALGRPQDALDWLDREIADVGKEEALSLRLWRPYALATAGRRGEAVALLEELANRLPTTPTWDYAVVVRSWARVGETEKAIDWLMRSGHYAAELLRVSRFEPEMRPLLADPRVQVQIRGAGLEGYPVTGPGSPEPR